MGTGMGRGRGRGTGTGRGTGRGTGMGMGMGSGRGTGREERPMIIRIEIYSEVSEEQISELRRVIADELGLPGSAIITETLPEREEEYTPPTEPEEGDWITQDYKTWWMNNSGGFIVTDPDDWPAQMKEIMEGEQWWPNLWYLGERGDWNLLDVNKGTFA
jgi:hypothetical protein